MIINLNNKSKLNICIVIFTVLSLFITSYIFYNSSQKADDSNERSDKVVEKVQPILDPEEKIEKEDFSEYTRKAAHVIEFAALGLCVGIVFVCIYGKSKKIFISLPMLLTLSVAVTDEFIQSFSDRTSCLKDVLIDFSGACGGLLIVLISVLIYSTVGKRKKYVDA